MKKALLGAVLVAAVGYGAWQWRGSKTTTESTDDKLVVDRLWIDHIPKGERDIIQVFVAITEQPFGVFQATSQWKGQFELFRYERNGGELRIYYGQTGERETVKAKATKCSEKGMDFCLELGGATRGVKKYYSMKGWEIDGATDVGELEHRIKGLLPAGEGD